MQTLTVIYILFAFIVALLLVYFQYFLKEKHFKSRLILVFLRFVSVFLILVLLINPKIEKKNYEIIKPKLLVAVDNSSSIAFAKQDAIVHSLVNQIKSNSQLNKKFDIQYFAFGNSLKNSTNFHFQDNRTNIYQPLKELNAITKNQIAPIVLISDGNQTYGKNYKYYNSKQAIYPIIIGDTTQFSDLEIKQINVNKYVNVGNNLEVEVFVYFSGDEKVNANLIVEKDNQIVYKQQLIFSKNNKSEHIQFKLPANRIGKQLYKAKIKPFKDEKNIINNYKNFDIEVLNEQANIALVYNVLHPDIGMIKRVVETNKQRKVNLINLNNIKDYSIDNDIFILYQPNNKFDKIFNLISTKNKNYFIITGRNTDWNFLNNVQSQFKKNYTLSTEKYDTNYNIDFNLFNTHDIGFSNFSPLEDVFGQIKLMVPYEALLLKNINGFDTDNPLLVAISNENNRRILLFGENSWRWRALSYLDNQSFEEFDQFFNNLIQFLTISKKSIPIELKYNSFYYANEPIKIMAKTYDKNLNFDVNANLELIINGKKERIPFNLNNNFYEVQIPNLKSGDYNFIVKNTLNSNQVTGLFTVAKYEVEHEVKTSDVKSLRALATNSNGNSYYPNQINNFTQYLVENQNYTSTQKENKKMISFIDWKWVLSLIIISLSLEWFIRKYRGLI